MKVFGLTGGIGMGKSTAHQLLSARGIPVVDTDLLARQVVEPGQPALTEIQSTFGSSVISADGTLSRKDLARVVFSDPNAREKLERILHPRIRELWRKQLADWRNENHKLAVVVIPLLFETGAETELDRTICAACSSATQQQRLLKRGWSPEQIEQRLAAQWSVDKKIAKSDYMVWTEGEVSILADQLDRIVPDC
jgi:dephospho-CoA kinase